MARLLHLPILLRAMLGQFAGLDIPGRWGRVDAFARGRVDLARVSRRFAGRG